MKPNEPNHGEGNRVADREYREGVREFISKGKVVPAAKAAKDFVDKDPAGASRAEAAAERGPRGSLVDRVRRAMSSLRARFTK